MEIEKKKVYQFLNEYSILDNVTETLEKLMYDTRLLNANQYQLADKLLDELLDIEYQLQKDA